MKKELAIVFILFCVVFYFGLRNFGCQTSITNDFTSFGVEEAMGYRITQISALAIACPK